MDAKATLLHQLDAALRRPDLSFSDQQLLQMFQQALRDDKAGFATAAQRELHRLSLDEPGTTTATAVEATHEEASRPIEGAHIMRRLIVLVLIAASFVAGHYFWPRSESEVATPSARLYWRVEQNGRIVYITFVHVRDGAVTVVDHMASSHKHEVKEHKTSRTTPRLVKGTRGFTSYHRGDTEDWWYSTPGGHTLTAYFTYTDDCNQDTTAAGFDLQEGHKCFADDPCHWFASHVKGVSS